MIQITGKKKNLWEKTTKKRNAAKRNDQMQITLDLGVREEW